MCSHLPCQKAVQCCINTKHLGAKRNYSCTLMIFQSQKLKCEIFVDRLQPQLLCESLCSTSDCTIIKKDLMIMAVYRIGISYAEKYKI